MGRRPLPKRRLNKLSGPLDVKTLTFTTTCGISSPFELLSRTSGQVTNALLTHSPLRHHIATTSSFDLHVLGTPPAFILSQDQTLRKKLYTFENVLRYGFFTGIVQGCTFYHSSVVKVPSQLYARCQLSGLDFTSLALACQGALRPELAETQLPMSLS